jgi:hypothetical protein
VVNLIQTGELKIMAKICSLVQVAKLFIVATIYVGTASGNAQTSQILAKDIEQVRYADQFLVSADIGQAVTSAFADCGSAFCKVVIPASSTAYTMSTPIQLSPGSTLCGSGSGNTIVNYTGNGYAITVKPGTIDSNAVNQAKLCGFSLLGNNTALAGINIHDVVGTILEDIRVTGFTAAGASAIWLNNQSAWTERTSMLHVALGKENGGNSIGIRMSLNPSPCYGGGSSCDGYCIQGGSPNTAGTCPSFGYSRFLDLRINLEANQTGLQIENGALFYNSTVIAGVNIDAPTGATVINVQSGGLSPCNDLSIAGVASGSGASGVKVANNAVFTGQGFVILNDAVNSVAGNGIYGIGTNTACNPFTTYQNGLPDMSAYSAPTHVVTGYSLGSGVSTVSLTGSSVFQNAASYVCNFSYNGSSTNITTPISYQIISKSQFKITGQPYIGVNYVCTGS